MKTNYIGILIISFYLLSCKSSFDSTEWNKNDIDWQWTNIRENMVDDLIANDTLIGMDTLQVYHLLGKPEWSTDSSKMFLLREIYTTDIDPVYIKYLNVIFDNNKVRKCEIYKTR